MDDPLLVDALDSFRNIGAIGSIAQVAQLGTQLSLSLYSLAQTIGSANKDVQYIAKDISLFSAVLKDLGRAFERGKTVQLYRADVYDTSLLIVKECKDVFAEIEGILTKSSRDGSSADRGISLDRTGKFMWLFRKSRVQLLRGNLESLKSTILVELAVLNYADKVSPPSAPSRADVDDLLALKSLVLANEAATQEFRDLMGSTEDGLSSTSPAFGPMATFGIGHLTQRSLMTTEKTAVPVKPQLSSPHINLARVGPGSQIPCPSSHNFSSHTPPQKVSSMAAPSTPLSLRHAKAWGLHDRLEHALRKVELARWEQERIEENLSVHPHLRAPNQSASTTPLVSRLINNLVKSGLSQARAGHVVALFQEEQLSMGIRTLTDQKLTTSPGLVRALRELGIPWSLSKNEIGKIQLSRWMPDLLEDVLWEHTRHSLRQLWKSHPGAPMARYNIQPVSSGSAHPASLQQMRRRSTLSLTPPPPPTSSAEAEPRAQSASVGQLDLLQSKGPEDFSFPRFGSHDSRILSEQERQQIRMPPLSQFQQTHASLPPPSLKQQQLQQLQQQPAQQQVVHQQLSLINMPPTEVPHPSLDTTVASRMEPLEKRKRNAGASARFRVRSRGRAPALTWKMGEACPPTLAVERPVLSLPPIPNHPHSSVQMESNNVYAPQEQQAQDQNIYHYAHSSSRSLVDYQMQLMLGEQQNKRRLMMARQEQDKQTEQKLEDGVSMEDRRLRRSQRIIDLRSDSQKGSQLRSKSKKRTSHQKEERLEEQLQVDDFSLDTWEPSRSEPWQLVPSEPTNSLAPTEENPPKMRLAGDNVYPTNQHLPLHQSMESRFPNAQSSQQLDPTLQETSQTSQRRMAGRPCLANYVMAPAVLQRQMNARLTEQHRARAEKPRMQVPLTGLGLTVVNSLHTATGHAHFTAASPPPREWRDPKRCKATSEFATEQHLAEQHGATNLSSKRMIRMIKPRQAVYPSEIERQEKILVGDDGRSRKKRGRPTKAERERREVDAGLRNEVYEPLAVASGAVATPSTLKLSHSHSSHDRVFQVAPPPPLTLPTPSENHSGSHASSLHVAYAMSTPLRHRKTSTVNMLSWDHSQLAPIDLFQSRVQSRGLLPSQRGSDPLPGIREGFKGFDVTTRGREEVGPSSLAPTERPRVQHFFGSKDTVISSDPGPTMDFANSAIGPVDLTTTSLSPPNGNQRKRQRAVSERFVDPLLAPNLPPCSGNVSVEPVLVPGGGMVDDDVGPEYTAEAQLERGAIQGEVRDDASRVVDRLLALWTFVDSLSGSGENPGWSEGIVQ